MHAQINLNFIDSAKGNDNTKSSIYTQTIEN